MNLRISSKILFWSLLLNMLFIEDVLAQAGKVSVHSSMVSTKILGDPSNASFGAGAEIGAQLKLGGHFSLVGFIGFSQLNGIIASDVFQTTYLPLSLNIRYNFLSDSRFNVFAEFGYGVANFNLTNRNNQKLPGRNVTKINAWTEFFPTSLGLEYFIKANISCGLAGQYSFTSTDALDHIEQYGFDKVFAFKLGINYYFGRPGIFKSSKLITSSSALTSEIEPTRKIISGNNGFSKNNENNSPNRIIMKDPNDVNENAGNNPIDLNRINEKQEAILEQLNKIENKLNGVMDISNNSNIQDAHPQETYLMHYKRALNIFYQGNYVHALNLFKALLDEDLNHKYASNCQYWLSECYYGLEQYDKALNSFKKVFALPNRNKDDDARFKIAYCFIKLGKLENATQEFETFIIKYPESEFYIRAKSDLNKLKPLVQK